MKRRILLYNLLIALLACSSCQKNLDLYVEQQTIATNAWYTTVTNSMPVEELKTNLSLPAYNDSFELNSNVVTVGTGSGLQCNFSPGSIVTSVNVPVSGKIYMETHLLKKKADMIRMNTPTTSNGRMLVSGGAFFIRLKQNGNDLQVSQQAGRCSLFCTLF